MDHRKYLKPAAAAEKIGVTPGCLANWRWKQVGPPYYTVGAGMIRYADDEIDDWMAANRQLTSELMRHQERVSAVASTSELNALPDRVRHRERASAA